MFRGIRYASLTNNNTENMITTRKVVLIAALMLGGLLSAHAQDYKTAIGLRLGYPVSASLKHFISEPGALELTAGFRSWAGYGWMNVGAMYQHHFPIEGVDGLKWYVGGGGSVFFWSFSNANIRKDYATTTFGIIAVGGIDYKFEDAPVNLSLDWAPIIAFNGYNRGFGYGYGAISARYTLK